MEVNIIYSVREEEVKGVKCLYFNISISRLDIRETCWDFMLRKTINYHHIFWCSRYCYAGCADPSSWLRWHVRAESGGGAPGAGACPGHDISLPARRPDMVIANGKIIQNYLFYAMLLYININILHITAQAHLWLFILYYFAIFPKCNGCFVLNTKECFFVPS